MLISPRITPGIPVASAVAVLGTHPILPRQGCFLWTQFFTGAGFGNSKNVPQIRALDSSPRLPRRGFQPPTW
jgi:hypothetical protein